MVQQIHVSLQAYKCILSDSRDTGRHERMAGDVTRSEQSCLIHEMMMMMMMTVRPSVVAECVEILFRVWEVPC
jgi:hypothetical protein